MEIIDKILLHEIIEYQGSADELKKKIDNPKSREYDVKWISNKEFKFFLKWSLGTLNRISIKGYATIKENKGNIEIHLKTNLRPEIYFFGGLFIFFFIVSLFENFTLPIWFYLLAPIAIIWFWWVLRFQEKYLFDRVKQHLLSEMDNQQK